MKTQKGITLIALIITIIVMLILVGVSVSVALNTGLFKSAQTAAKDTEAEKLKETAISNGAVTVKVGEEEKPFNSINEYVESLKGEEGDGEIKLAATPTHKFYFDNQVFLIDEDTSWFDVILTFDENRYWDSYNIGPNNEFGATWKYDYENGLTPDSLDVHVTIDGREHGYWIQMADPGTNPSSPPWSGAEFSLYVDSIVDSAPTNPSTLWWCGDLIDGKTADECYAEALFTIKLEEI